MKHKLTLQIIPGHSMYESLNIITDSDINTEQKYSPQWAQPLVSVLVEP